MTQMSFRRVRWSGQRQGRNLLAADYRWEPPALPLQIESFAESKKTGPEGPACLSRQKAK